MKHQWSFHPGLGGTDEYAICEACGQVATVLDRHIGVSIATQDCSAAQPTMILSEFDSTPTLVQIDEDLWVNPAHIVYVEFRAKDSMTAADDPRVVIKQVGSSHAVRDKSLAEVVALINGTAE